MGRIGNAPWRNLNERLKGPGSRVNALRLKLVVAYDGRPFRGWQSQATKDAVQDFLEAAFARFKLVEGVGCSIVYSHRIYGAKVGDQMSKWLNDNGPKMEKTLMDWKDSPSPASLCQLPRTANDGR